MCDFRSSNTGSSVRRAQDFPAGHSSLHGVYLDFVPGMLYDREDIKGQIWGGLAVAVMLPERRAAGLTVHAPFKHSLSVLLKDSIYGTA